MAIEVRHPTQPDITIKMTVRPALQGEDGDIAIDFDPSSAHVGLPKTSIVLTSSQAAELATDLSMEQGGG